METQKDKIYCYSGTGNCFAAAKQLANLLDMTAVHLIDEITTAEITGKRCIVIFPTYAYCMPTTVKRFILNASFKAEYIAVLTTYGSHHGGALAEAVRLFKKRGVRVAYTNGVKSIENYVHMFGWPKQKAIETLTQKQSEKTAQIADDIKQQKQNKRLLFRPGSSFVSFIFRRAISVFEKRYRFLPTCNGCGICARVCPANAICMQDKKPVIKRKQCDHCQACLQLCPNRAIQFGRIKPTSPRYKHKDVTLNELLKR